MSAVIPNVRKAWLALLDRLRGVLESDPERGREDLREVIEDKIRLCPDESGRFLWADCALGLKPLLPSAEIIVAGACFVMFLPSRGAPEPSKRDEADVDRATRPISAKENHLS